MRSLATFVLATAAAAALVTAGSAQAYAPAAEATVHPGVQTFTAGAQCTANFVFEKQRKVRRGKNRGERRLVVFIGQSAHCAGTGGSDETDGCRAATLPLGTPVRVDGATRPGKLVYSSWVAMQANGEADPDACAYNDFALIKLRRADHGRVNPSVPVFGGPLGIGRAEVGEEVLTYGNSGIRGGAEELSPKRGIVVDSYGDGWSYDAYTATPGIPGDSGSAVLNERGAALGTLSTVQLAPLAGSNGISDLGRQLSYARDNGARRVRLVAGTEPFRP